jgi:UDP-2,3-diacylglucosamine pyrophosphatase LpxH
LDHLVIDHHPDPPWKGPADTADRQVDVAVLSDLHLGTIGCRADELLHYLSHLRPRLVILAGDVIDFTSGHPGYWPEPHLRIIRKLLKFLVHGIPVYYITGNHDAGLHRYAGLALGGLHVLRSLELELGNRRYLVVHGDQFDPAHHLVGKVLRRVGGGAYHLLLAFNNALNRCRRWCGLTPVALLPPILRFLGGVHSYIKGFVDRARDHARQADFAGIICGHIHQPRIDGDDAVGHYLNAGDWIQHCTALEHVDGHWRIHSEPAIRTSPATDDARLGADHCFVTAA